MNNFKTATIHGKKLSPKQRKLFAAVCKGQKMQQGGMINITGYLDGYPTANNPYNIIPGGNITMQGVSQPIMAIPIKNGKLGKKKMMQPGKNYNFDADYVHESRMQKGGLSPEQLTEFSNFSNGSKDVNQINKVFSDYGLKGVGHLYEPYSPDPLHPNTIIDPQQDWIGSRTSQALENARRLNIVPEAFQANKELIFGKDRYADTILNNADFKNMYPNYMDVASQIYAKRYKEYNPTQTAIKKEGGNIYAKGGDILDIYNKLFPGYLSGDDDNQEEQSNVSAPTADDILAAQQKLAEERGQFEQQKTDWQDQQQQEEDMMLATQGMDETTGNPYSAPANVGSVAGSGPSGFKSFSSPEEGRAALEHQLSLYQTGQTRNNVGPNSSLLHAMSVYAPSSDGNNPTHYAQFIANKLGISINTPIAQVDKKKWADAITIMEGNKHGNNPGNIRKGLGGVQQIIDKFSKGNIYTIPDERIINSRKQNN